MVNFRVGFVRTFSRPKNLIPFSFSSQTSHVKNHLSSRDGLNFFSTVIFQRTNTIFARPNGKFVPDLLCSDEIKSSPGGVLGLRGDRYVRAENRKFLRERL